MRALIIDDEPIALEKLRKYVNRIPQLSLAGSCSDGFEAIQFLETNDVDLIITDINMPDLNGLDFVRSLSHQPLVIFITAYPEHAIDGYKVCAVDYLLKPYGFVEFSEAIWKAHRRLSEKSAESPNDYIFIKTEYKYIRVSLSEIQFIKGFGEYLQIYVAGKDTPLLTLSSFAAIKEWLSQDFLQIHRSYIVNMNHVIQIERNRVVMDAETYLPIGDSYKVSFQNYLAAHAIGKK